MASDSDITKKLGTTFQTLIEEETKGLPTVESPLIVEQAETGISLLIHDCLQKKINDFAARVNLTKDEARAAFVAAVLDGLMPKLGLIVDRAAVEKVTIERRVKLLNVPIKVVHGSPTVVNQSKRFLKDTPLRLESPGFTPRVSWQIKQGLELYANKATKVRELSYPRQMRMNVKRDNRLYPPRPVVFPPGNKPKPTGISRADDKVISVDAAEYTLEQLVAKRLKEHETEMRAIVEEALKQKRPLFSVQLFEKLENSFFSPKIGGAADEQELTWGKTFTNGVREGFKLTVKGFTSLVAAGAFLYASNVVGHWLRPDIVPEPVTVVHAVANQFKNVDMEVSTEGFKLTAKKEEEDVEAKEAKRLLDEIGGGKPTIEQQKELVRYLELKYSEGLITGVPLVKAGVVDKVKAMVKENEAGLLNQIKQAVTQTTTPKEPPAVIPVKASDTPSTTPTP